MKAVAKQPPDPAAVQRLSLRPIKSLLHTTCVCHHAFFLRSFRQTRSRKPRAPTSMAGFSWGRPPKKVHKTLERVANDPEVKSPRFPQSLSDGKVAPGRSSAAVAAAARKYAGHGENLERHLPVRSSRRHHLPPVPPTEYTRIAVHSPTMASLAVFFDINDTRDMEKTSASACRIFYTRRGLPLQADERASSPRCGTARRIKCGDKEKRVPEKRGLPRGRTNSQRLNWSTASLPCFA